MQLPIVNEQERHMLQALLAKGVMTPEQLTELCKNAFGWSTSVIRRTQKALLAQGLVQERDGLLTPTVTMEDLENTLWDSRLQGTFEWQPPAQPKFAAKQPFFKSVWFWTTCAACVVIAVLCALLIFPSTPETTIPDELQICKEALDKWQEKDSYHIFLVTEILSSEYNIQLPNPLTSYYFHEDDWMILCWDPSNLSAVSPNYFHQNGQLYISNNALNPEWQPSDMTFPSAPKPWPITFAWENCELTYWDTATENSETRIRFRIIDKSHEITGVYEVTFVFDKSQNLTEIEAIRIQSDLIVRRDTYHLMSTDAEEISKLFSDALIPASNDDEPVPEPG